MCRWALPPPANGGRLRPARITCCRGCAVAAQLGGPPARGGTPAQKPSRGVWHGLPGVRPGRKHPRARRPGWSARSWRSPWRSFPNRTLSDSGRYSSRGPACRGGRPHLRACRARRSARARCAHQRLRWERVEVLLGGGQMRMAKNPLHVGGRDLRIAGHPIGRRVTKIVKGPVRPQAAVGAHEHRPRRAIGQRPERFPQCPPQRIIRPGVHQPLRPGLIQPQPDKRVRRCR